MPDGSSVSLNKFQGLSQVGETSVRDQVNRHYLQTFGVSLVHDVDGASTSRCDCAVRSVWSWSRRLATLRRRRTTYWASLPLGDAAEVRDEYLAISKAARSDAVGDAGGEDLLGTAAADLQHRLDGGAVDKGARRAVSS